MIKLQLDNFASYKERKFAKGISNYPFVHFLFVV